MSIKAKRVCCCPDTHTDNVVTSCPVVLLYLVYDLWPSLCLIRNASASGSGSGIKRWRAVSLSHPFVHHHYLAPLDWFPEPIVLRTSITFHMHFTSKSRTTNWLGPWMLLTWVFSLCLAVGQSQASLLFFHRVVSFFRAARSKSCRPIRMSLVATFLKLFQVSWRDDNWCCMCKKFNK